MTPARITTDGRHGVEYSSVCPFNCDGTRLLLLASNPGSILDHFGLYDGSGQFLRDLPIAASQEPRWDRKNPGTLYFISGNMLMRMEIYLLSDPIMSQVKVFTEYASISGKGESDISVDGDHFVFAGTKADATVEVFIYSLKDGKGPIFPQTKPIDGLKITATNQIIVSYSDGSGIWVME